MSAVDHPLQKHCRETAVQLKQLAVIAGSFGGMFSREIRSALTDVAELLTHISVYVVDADAKVAELRKAVENAPARLGE